MKTETDLEVLAKAKPYIRSILAFVSHIRWGQHHSGAKVVQYHYDTADIFLQKLEDDIKKREG